MQFTDGTRVHADVVIYCTGYRITFPFLDDGLIAAPDNRIELFRRVFSPRHPSLAFVGLLQPIGAIMPLAEAQGRLHRRLPARRVPPARRAGGCTPTSAARTPAMRKRYVASKRHTIQVDFDRYLYELERERRRGAARARGRGLRAAGARARRRRRLRPAARRMTIAPDAGPGRREATKAANRAAIIAAARAVFADLGYGGASVRDVIRRTDLASGTFYNYFPDKEALFRAVVEESAVSVRTRARVARRQARSLEEFVTAGYREYFGFLASDPEAFSLMRRNSGTIRAMFDEPIFGAGIDELAADLRVGDRRRHRAAARRRVHGVGDGRRRARGRRRDGQARAARRRGRDALRDERPARRDRAPRPRSRPGHAVSARAAAGRVVAAAAAVVVVVAALAVPVQPGRAQSAAADPFEEQATCEGRVPGPEPGRTVLQICVPRLVRALVDNGLVDVPQAARLQPIVLGRMGFDGLGGAPVVLRLDGGPRQLDGLRLANRSRTAITARIDIVYWNGRIQSPSLVGHRELLLRPGTRLSQTRCPHVPPRSPRGLRDDHAARAAGSGGPVMAEQPPQLSELWDGWRRRLADDRRFAEATSPPSSPIDGTRGDADSDADDAVGAAAERRAGTRRSRCRARGRRGDARAVGPARRGAARDLPGTRTAIHLAPGEPFHDQTGVARATRPTGRSS